MEKMLLRFPRELRNTILSARVLFEQQQSNLKKASPIFSSAFAVANKRNKHDDASYLFSTQMGSHTHSYISRQTVDIKEREVPAVPVRVNLDEPEPAYERISYAEEQFYSHYDLFHCQHGEILPKLEIAYETWGKLNEKKNNVVLLFSGLSASSHARSHEEVKNSQPGWWEKFIGPDGKIDTNKYFVICVNNLGGCFGSTGPSSINPDTNKPYGGEFPIITVSDMVRMQFLLLDHLGINKLHAVVGSSLGGMSSVMAAALFPKRIDRMVSISGCAAAGPTAIAFRYIQRLALMSDPKWKDGHYYDSGLPAHGMQLARKVATLTYRSGPEWNERFGRRKIQDSRVELPRIDGAEFEIEDYIRHQGESFFLKSQYDPNSLLFLSKAMDLFDMSEGFDSMEESIARITMPSLIPVILAEVVPATLYQIMGASSDILFPAVQQVELAELIRGSGNTNVTLKIIEGQYGHDTFLLDVNGMGTHTKEFLEGTFETKQLSW